MEEQLEGVRVAVLAMDGFEQVEVTIPVRALKRAGADVRVLSLRPGRIRGVNFIWRGRKVPVDDLLADARPEDYGAVLLPGGFVNPDLLRQSRRAREFVRRAEELGRPIAVICHGAETLVSAGLVSGRRLATWPGIADDIRNAGAEWVDSPLVRDGRWVSSRGPQDLPAFIPGMIDLFAANAARNLAPIPRRMRWVAQLSRAMPLGLAAALVVGRRRRALAKRATPQRRAKRALETVAGSKALPDLGLLAAVAGLAGGKLAADRFRMQASPMR